MIFLSIVDFAIIYNINNINNKHGYNRPVVYKRFANPLKLRKKSEHGFFVKIRKSDEGELLTFVIKTGLKFIKEHIHDVQFTYIHDTPMIEIE